MGGEGRGENCERRSYVTLRTFDVSSPSKPTRSEITRLTPGELEKERRKSLALLRRIGEEGSREMFILFSSCHC